MIQFDERLKQLLTDALQEDVGDGDHSTLCCIPADAKGKAVLKIKQAGVLAGMEVAEKIFRLRRPAAVFIPHKKDGDSMQPGDPHDAEVQLPTSVDINGCALIMHSSG